MTTVVGKLPMVTLVANGAVVREFAHHGHLDAALRAAERLRGEVPGADKQVVTLVVRHCPRFLGTSSFGLRLAPQFGLSLADRVRLALRPRDLRTSPRSSPRVRDFLDFLIDAALEDLT